MTENEHTGQNRSSGFTLSPGLMYNRSVASSEQECKGGPTSPIKLSRDSFISPSLTAPVALIERDSDSQNSSGRQSIIIGHTIKDADQNEDREAKHKALKPITKKHPEYELAYDMMLGIRTVVGRIEAVQLEFKDSFSVTTTNSISHFVQEATMLGQRYENDFVGHVDPLKFTETKSYKFPNKGGKYTRPHLMKSFKFKDYCPQIFKLLRQLFSIDPCEYQMEVCGNYRYLEFISNSKSGQFFFFSHNQRFMVKTLSKTEAKLLRKIMPQYYSYIRKHPHSLLTKFFGMHRVKPHRRKHINFVIMSSVFYSEENLEIHEQYDLKGSTKGRRAGPGETMKKDLDMLESGVFIKVGRDKAKLFKQQLLLDTEFLRKNQIMDYSLLVGIHYRSLAKKKMLHERKESSHDIGLLAPAERSSAPSELGGRSGCSHELCKSEDTHARRKVKSLEMNARSRSKRNTANPWHRNHYQLSTPIDDKFIVPEIVSHREFDPLPEDDVLYKNNIYPQETKSQEETETEDELIKTNPFTDTFGGMCYRHEETGALGDEIYFTGVIDILSQFNRRKKVESFFKSRVNDRQVISAVDPELYSRRFNRFIETKIM